MNPGLLRSIADIIPIIGAIALIVVIVLLVRARGRISTGSVSAGPRDIEVPTMPGVTESAWNLTALDGLYRENPGWILNNLQREARRLEIPLPRAGLNVEDDIERVLRRLEAHLDPTSDTSGGSPR